MRRLALLALLLAPALAAAHGSTPAPATCTAPPRLVSEPSDGGDRSFAPYAFPTADASFTVRFEDGDVDPTAHHAFYYLDHAPPLAFDVAAVKAVATPIADVPDGLWAACSCFDDLGFTCPDAGARPCANELVWSTAALPAGAYWLIAVTDDAPYALYTVSDGPVRIGHGATPPPAAIVVRPDGFGTYDTRYRIRWLATGEPPLHVDLAYASDQDLRAGAAFQPIADDVPLVAEPDGSYAYDWDLSSLPSGHIYHVRATARDATGASTHTVSRRPHRLPPRPAARPRPPRRRRSTRSAALERLRDRRAHAVVARPPPRRLGAAPRLRQAELARSASS